MNKINNITNRLKILEDRLKKHIKSSYFLKRVNKFLMKILKIKKYPIDCINKKKFDKKIAKFKKLGLNEKARDKKLVVSLTSFPERMYDIHYALYSLLNQSTKPDEVVLWLGVEQFPNKEKDVPKNVLDLGKNGLTIKWCEDLKSYKKLIPSLEEYPNDIIITADDDIFYPHNWLELLYVAYLKEPDYIHCHRAHRIIFDEKNEILPYAQWQSSVKNVEKSFLNFCTTGGGVLYSPNILHKDVFNKELFLELCPNADDIWFWAMVILNNIKINVVADNIQGLIYVNPERTLGLSGEKNLWEYNAMNGGNDLQLKKVFEHYPELKKRICFDSSQYWEERYSQAGNSGAGSYGRLAKFKADVINNFINQNSINSVIEFGVGDGNQLSLFNIPSYVGYDVSQTILENISKKFNRDKTKIFKHVDQSEGDKADLTLSLDVIYHLIEENVFDNYMQKLFEAANKYVIIYASNKNEFHCQHVKHRKFTDWIDNNIKKWKLLTFIPNLYPFDESDSDNTSFADFYIYERI